MNCMVTPKPPTMSLAHSRTDQRSDSARPVAKAQASIRRHRRSHTNRRRSATSEAMQPTFVGAWLDQPNEMLGSLKPVEAIKRGQIDLVWQVVEGLRSGAQL